jgi:hypothetical protein
MNWFNTIVLRIGLMDRTEMAVALGAAMLMGFLCMRGLSSKLR